MSYKIWFGIAIFMYCANSVVWSIQAAFLPSGTDLVYDFEAMALEDSTVATNVALPAWASILWLIIGIPSAVIPILFCIVTCRTRAQLRQRYGIPTQACGECEDCCCAYWCLTCTLCQMARHTADYDKYAADCCTATGLKPDAPEVV